MSAGSGRLPEWHLVRRPSSTFQRGRHRSRQDLEIEPERPSVDVREVELRPSIEAGRAAIGPLPYPGDARLHRQPPTMPEVVRFDLFWQRRPWSDKGHVAAENIP